MFESKCTAITVPADGRFYHQVEIAPDFFAVFPHDRQLCEESEDVRLSDGLPCVWVDGVAHIVDWVRFVNIEIDLTWLNGGEPMPLGE